jgi:hypothetical protein
MFFGVAEIIAQAFLLRFHFHSIVFCIPQLAGYNIFVLYFYDFLFLTAASSDASTVALHATDDLFNF